MSVGVAVSPDVLLWAVQRSGREPGAFEKRFPAWHQWVDAAKSPTIHQVEELASFTHLPFGAFFLEEPPASELPIPDYRMGADGLRSDPSQDLLEVIETSQLRQDWFREYAVAHDLGEARITRIPDGASVEDAAAFIVEDLRFTVTDREPMTREGARNHLRHAFEELGGIAVFTTMVGNDNHRPLDRDEFRGFALADPFTPLIFVNAHDDSLSGQIFTFLHEYVHIARSESGVGDEEAWEHGATTSSIEQWCNAVAAEALVPRADLRAQFDSSRSLLATLDDLARRYLASTLTILIQLRELALVPRDGFAEIFEAEQKRIASILASQPKRSGGNHYLNQPFRLGETFSRAVLGDVRRGRTSYTEAMRLLNMRSVTQLNRYADSLGVG